MGLRKLIARLRGNRERLPVLADAISSRGMEAVWPLVESRLGELAGHQLRGYVRARGRTILQRLVAETAEHEGSLGTDERAELFELATGVLARQIDARHRAGRTMGLTRRRAA